MTNKFIIGWVVLSLMLVLVACGGAATSEPEIAVTNTTAAVATATEIEITETSEPEATEEETQEVLTTLVAPNPTDVVSGNTPQDAVIVANVEAADIAEGERLYTAALIPACTTCHMIDSVSRQTAPSLVNFSEIAGTRLEGESAYTYAYNSIRYANQYVVDGYVAGVMPIYDGVLTDQEVYDLIAYIWTLSDS
ncbi:MAG: cytochrome c [Phototrophicaceae bacterium]